MISEKNLEEIRRNESFILKDNLPTAMAGEIKEVKPGFARNFLIPQGIAELANKSSIERVEKLRKQAEVRGEER